MQRSVDRTQASPRPRPPLHRLRGRGDRPGPSRARVLPSSLRRHPGDHTARYRGGDQRAARRPCRRRRDGQSADRRHPRRVAAPVAARPRPRHAGGAAPSGTGSPPTSALSRLGHRRSRPHPKERGHGCEVLAPCGEAAPRHTLTHGPPERAGSDVRPAGRGRRRGLQRAVPARHVARQHGPAPRVVAHLERPRGRGRGGAGRGRRPLEPGPPGGPGHGYLPGARAVGPARSGRAEPRRPRASRARRPRPRGLAGGRRARRSPRPASSWPTCWRR